MRTVNDWMRRSRRRRFIDTYEFPPALHAKLVTEFGDTRKADIALDGLRGWYLASLYTDRLMGMPSRAVDEAWHEMILMTREYAAFCRRAFGRYLHHSPAAVLALPMHEILTETLAVVDKHDLPLRLFTADAETEFPGGYVWEAEALSRMREAIAERERERRSADGGGGDGDGGGDGGGCGGCGGCG